MLWLSLNRRRKKNKCLDGVILAFFVGDEFKLDGLRTTWGCDDNIAIQNTQNKEGVALTRGLDRSYVVICAIITTKAPLMPDF